MVNELYSLEARLLEFYDAKDILWVDLKAQEEHYNKVDVFSYIEKHVKEDYRVLQQRVPFNIRHYYFLYTHYRPKDLNTR